MNIPCGNTEYVVNENLYQQIYIEHLRFLSLLLFLLEENMNNKLSEKYKTIDELILAIEDYINYYNYDRIKVKLKGLSPVNYRLQSSNQKLFINCPTFGVQFTGELITFIPDETQKDKKIN